MLDIASTMIDGSYHAPMSSEIIEEVQLIPKKFYSEKSKVLLFKYTY